MAHLDEVWERVFGPLDRKAGDIATKLQELASDYRGRAESDPKGVARNLSKLARQIARALDEAARQINETRDMPYDEPRPEDFPEGYEFEAAGDDPEDPEEEEGEASGWGLSHDGWNDRELEEGTGIMEWIAGVERIAYELRNGRRGSYAKFGDTVEDLAQELENKKDELESVIDRMDKMSG